MSLRDYDRKPFRFSLSSRSEKELKYMAELERCFQSSPYSTVEKLMSFPMYVPRQDITKFICKYEIFKRIINMHGSIVECGVLFGGGLMTFAQLSAILEPANHTRKIIGFDTFGGFPEVAVQDLKEGSSEEARRGGLSVDSYEEIKRCVTLYDMNRFVGNIPKVELIKGDVKETIPAYLKDNSHLIVSLLYLDFDVYEPTRIALEHFVPRMPKGAVIGFDELSVKAWPGETVAVLEQLKLTDLRIERFAFGSTISYAVI